jgi:hypothetical protein
VQRYVWCHWAEAGGECEGVGGWVAGIAGSLLTHVQAGTGPSSLFGRSCATLHPAHETCDCLGWPLSRTVHPVRSIWEGGQQRAVVQLGARVVHRSSVLPSQKAKTREITPKTRPTSGSQTKKALRSRRLSTIEGSPLSTTTTLSAPGSQTSKRASIQYSNILNTCV